MDANDTWVFNLVEKWGSTSLVNDMYLQQSVFCYNSTFYIYIHTHNVVGLLSHAREPTITDTPMSGILLFYLVSCSLVLDIVCAIDLNFDSETLPNVDLLHRVLQKTTFNRYNTYIEQPYVSNGLVGSRISNLGFGFTYDQNPNTSSSMLSNGWPLFNNRYAGAFFAGFYDSQPNTTGTNFPEVLDGGGHESVIASVPQWTDLRFTIDINGTKFTLDPKQTNTTDQSHIQNYMQSLDMNSGVVTTQYTWLDLINIRVLVLAHEAVETLGLMKIILSPVNENNSSVELIVEQFLDSESCERCTLVDHGIDGSDIYMVVSPEGVDYASTVIYSSIEVEDEPIDTSFFELTEKLVTQSFNVTVNANITLVKYVGLSSSDLLNTNDTETIFDFTKKTVETSAMVGYNTLYEEHIDGWSGRWSNVSVSLKSDPYAQISIEASIYHLLANSRKTANNLTAAMPVGGLSSDSYAGMVFWDMDLWMIPALLPVAPENAISALRYRSHLHQQARENAIKYGYTGSVYPWTSGRFGNCTGTGPCVNYEYHLNVAICYSIWKLYLSGAIDEIVLRESGWPILSDTANFFVDYVQWNNTINKYETFNLTDPDEYANFQNNAAYTNVGIAQVMKWAAIIGELLDENVEDAWADVMEEMYLPVSPANLTLEYDEMSNDIIVKQADVVLISYMDDQDQFLPEYFGYDKQRAVNDLIYYSDHQTSQGPAMSYPVYGAVSQKLSDFGCGHMTYLKKSYEPFIRFPFAQMSEQNNDNFDVNGGTHPAFPFNTGHAGVIQGFYYGLLGIRYSYMFVEDKFQRVLHVDPVHLPLFKSDYEIKGFKYLNQSITITLNTTHLTLLKETDGESLPLYVDHRNQLGGAHNLSDILEIPLFVPGRNIPGSLTECQSTVIAIDKGMDGDISQAVIDGDNSTIWQSVSKEVPASLLIDLEVNKKFTKGAIIWGSRPAFHFALSVLSDINTLENNYTIFANEQVEISSPYVPNSEVVLVDRNYTVFDLAQIIETRYVVLTIEGVIDQDDNPNGGEVAEFVLLD